MPPISSVRPPRQHFGNEVDCFCEHKHSWIITLPSIAPVLVQVPRKEYLKREQIKLPGQVFLLLRSGELEESKPVSVGKCGDLIVQDRYYLLQYLVQIYLLFCSDLLRRNQWVNADHDTDTKNLLIKSAFGRCAPGHTSQSLGKWADKSFSCTLLNRASIKIVESYSPVLCYLVAVCVCGGSPGSAALCMGTRGS